MGLDMYMTKRTYVQNWNYQKPEEKHKITIKKGEKLVDPNYIDTSKISYIIEEVGTWRKANAIHGWMVKHVQFGKDDCHDYWVPLETLKELLDTVNKVLDNSKLVDGLITNGKTLKPEGWEDIKEVGKFIEDPTTAKEYLPTTDGFFFGAYNYDQYYYNDLVDTRKILEDAIKKAETGDIYYHSSW